MDFRGLHRAFKPSSMMQCAMILSCMIGFGMVGFSTGLQSMIHKQNKALLGADMQINGSMPMSDAQLTWLKSQGLEYYHSRQFASMLCDHIDCRIVAVLTFPSPYIHQYLLPKQSKLDRGQIMIDRGLQKRFHHHKHLTLGQHRLALSHEPFPNIISPRFIWLASIILRQDDLASTQLVTTGSRSLHVTYIFGSDDRIKKTYTHFQKNLRPDQRALAAFDASSMNLVSFESLLKQTQHALAIILLLSGLALLMGCQRLMNDRRATMAILISYGVKPKKLLMFILKTNMKYMILTTGVIGLISLTGSQWLNDHAFPVTFVMPPSLCLKTAMLMLIVMLALLGPILMAINDINPLTDRIPKPSKTYISFYQIVPGLSALSIMIISLMGFDDNLWIILFVIGVLSIIIKWTYQSLIRVLQYLFAHHCPSHILGLFQLRYFQKPQAFATYTMTLIVILAVVSLSFIGSATDRLRMSITKNKPSVFLTNILPTDQQPLHAWLKQHNITHQGFYPVIKARLIKRNGQAITQGLSSLGKQDNALDRDLNLTQWSTLPTDNKIITGKWHGDARPKTPEISVEVKLAKRLDIRLNDRLTFWSAGQQIQGRVTSLRALSWDSLRPNFFFIFSTGSLDHFSQTAMTSLQLSTTTPTGSLHNLTQRFGNINVIDLSDIAKRLQTIGNQLSNALIGLLMILALISAVLYLACLHLNTPLRVHHHKGLKKLGITDQTQHQANSIERWVSIFIAMTIGISIGYLTLKLIMAYGSNLIINLSPLLLILVILYILMLGLLSALWSSRSRF